MAHEATKTQRFPFFHPVSNGVGTLDAPFSDPDMETLRNKLNELINALRR